MHAALAAGHDRAVLQAALRRLQQPQVAHLITYLLKWVTRHPGEHFFPHSPLVRWNHVCCSDISSKKAAASAAHTFFLYESVWGGVMGKCSNPLSWCSTELK